MLDVWEVAHVWAWPLREKSKIDHLEHFLYHRFNPKSKLMNGSIPPKPGKLPFSEPQCHKVQILPDEEIASRLRPEHRLPRQIAQFNQLMDYILMVKDAEHLRAALQAHFERLVTYYRDFTKGKPDPEAE